MDLQSLNIFIQVAEMSSFTRAGEHLGYSQPTVSFQIKQLEKELGVPLFDRIGHTVSLTDAGRDALVYAQKICHMSEEMFSRVSSKNDVKGEVRIAMADSLCTPLVEEQFMQFRKGYPNVALHVMTAGTTELFRLLDHNEVDLVCTLDRQFSNRNYVIVSEERISVSFVVSKENPLADKYSVKAEEILKEPFLLTEKGMSYRRMLEEILARRGMDIHPVFEFGDADMIYRMVERGLGVSYLPDFVTEKGVSEGKIIRLKVEGIETEVWKQLFYRRDKWVSTPMQAIMDHLSGIALRR